MRTAQLLGLIVLFLFGTTLSAQPQETPTTPQPDKRSYQQFKDLWDEPATLTEEMKTAEQAIQTWLEEKSPKQEEMGWGVYLYEVVGISQFFLDLIDFVSATKKASPAFLLEADKTANRLSLNLNRLEEQSKSFALRAPAFRTVLIHWTDRVLTLQKEKAEEIKKYKEEVQHQNKKDAQLLHLLEDVMKSQDEWLKENKEQAQKYTEFAIESDNIPDIWARMLRERVK